MRSVVAWTFDADALLLDHPLGQRRHQVQAPLVQVHQLDRAVLQRGPGEDVADQSPREDVASGPDECDLAHDRLPPLEMSTRPVRPSARVLDGVALGNDGLGQAIAQDTEESCSGTQACKCHPLRRYGRWPCQAVVAGGRECGPATHGTCSETEATQSAPRPPQEGAANGRRRPRRATSSSPVRPEWLDRWHEEILEPDLPIVDPHHHLWDRPGWRYLLDDLLADLNSGHNIVATVFLEGRAMYRADGPEALRPVGETEFVNGVAAMSASGIYGPTRVCAGIVGHADLRLGAAVQEVLEAHIRAGGGRFRGIRHSAAWDADPLDHAAEQPDAARAPGRPGVPRGLRRAWRRSASRSTPGSTIPRSPS